ncbi:hypothetical protein SK128_011476 [Halocaridina rubra]|uniref:Uncharacterized protein n=1 Tax=Halocaridina rubra TaxID=373956 RepID=A0AAN8WXS2_HALRR
MRPPEEEIGLNYFKGLLRRVGSQNASEEASTWNKGEIKAKIELRFGVPHAQIPFSLERTQARSQKPD